MPHDVFISHSNIDKAPAQAACAIFEQNGIRCWIAPRDVPAGSEWAEAIIEAIEAARIMVLIFSTHSNESRQVKREIELAVSRGLTIMPIRLEKIAPTKSMAYYMAGVHWLDALTPPLDAHFKQMVSWIKPQLGGGAAPEPPPQAKPGAEAKPKAEPRSALGITSDEAGKLIEEARELATTDRRPDALRLLREVVTRIGEPADLSMSRQLALALHRTGLNLENVGKSEQALAAHDEVLRRYRDSLDPALRLRVATVLVDRGFSLDALKRWDDALASYDELEQRFGTSNEAGFIALMARAGVCRGIVLDSAGRKKEALAAYEAMIRRYEASADAQLLEKVAIALYNRAGMLEHLGRKKEAISACEDIVRRYSSHADAALKGQVELARSYLDRLR